MRRSAFSIFLSMFLSVLMLIGVLPISAMAAGSTAKATGATPNYTEFRGKGMSTDSKTGVMVYDDLKGYYQKSQANVALSTDYKTSTVNTSTGKNLAVAAEYKECPDLYVDWAIYYDEDIEGNTVIIKYGLSMMDSVQYVDKDGVITEGKSPIELTASYGNAEYNAGYEEVKNSSGKTRYTTRYYGEKGIIFYILNHSASERIGGEDDVSILFDYIDQGYVVVTLDYKCHPDATSPYIEQSLVSARAMFDSYTSDASLKGLGVKTSADYIYFLPEGCRLERDVWYWDTSIWGVNGTMEKYRDTWDSKIAGTSYDTLKIGKVSTVENLISKVTQKDGTSPIEYKLSMNIVYPSQPIGGYEAPLYIQEGTNYTRELNIETSYTRGAYTGFALNGYACVQYDHPYWPFLYRSEYSFEGSGSNYGMSQSSENNARAAVRCARYYAEELGYSSELVGAAGISKATPGISVLCIKDNKRIPQSAISGYDNSSYEGDIIVNGKVSQAIVQPFMYYDESNTEEVSSDCTVAYISSGNGIERLFGTGSYASYEKIPLVISGGTRDEYNCYNYWDDMVAWFTKNATEPFLPIVQLDQGHTFPVGYDNQFGYERFTAMVKFFDVYLKPDSLRAPEVLWVTPQNGATGVSVSGEWTVGPYTPYGWDVNSYYYGQTIQIRFLHSVDPESVKNGVFLTTEGGVPVEGEWIAEQGNTLFTFRHNGLVAGMRYVIDITETVKSENGVALEEGMRIRFKTEGTYAVSPVSEACVSVSDPNAVLGTGSALTVSNSKITLLTFDTETIKGAESVVLKAAGDAESTMKLLVYAMPGYVADADTVTYNKLIASDAWANKAKIGEYKAKSGIALALNSLAKIEGLGSCVTLALVSADELKSKEPYEFTLDFEFPTLGTALIDADGTVGVKADGTAVDAGNANVTINKPSSSIYLWRRTGAMSNGKIVKETAIANNQIFKVQTNPGEGQLIKFYNTVTEDYMTTADIGKNFRITFDIYPIRDLDIQVGFASASAGNGTKESPTSGAFSFYGATHSQHISAYTWTTVSCVITLSEDMVARQAGMATIKLLYPTEDKNYSAYTYFDNLVVEECTPALTVAAGDSYTLVTVNRGAALDQPITVTFPKAMDTTTLEDGVIVTNLITGDRVAGEWKALGTDGKSFNFTTGGLAAGAIYAVSTTNKAKTADGAACAKEIIRTVVAEGSYAVRPITSANVSVSEPKKHFDFGGTLTLDGDKLGVLTFSGKQLEGATSTILRISASAAKASSVEVYVLAGYQADNTLCYDSVASKLTTVNRMGSYEIVNGSVALDLSILSRLNVGRVFTLVLKAADGCNATVSENGVLLVSDTATAITLTAEDNLVTDVAKSYAEIVAAQVTVGKTVTLRVYAKMSRDYGDAKMKFTVNGKETVVTGVQQGGEYVYALEGLSYGDMTAEIRAELLAGDKTVAVLASYSVAQNFRNLAAKSAEELGIGAAKDAALKNVLNQFLTNGISRQALREYAAVKNG